MLAPTGQPVRHNASRCWHLAQVDLCRDEMKLPWRSAKRIRDGPLDDNQCRLIITLARPPLPALRPDGPYASLHGPSGAVSVALRPAILHIIGFTGAPVGTGRF